MIWNGFPFSKNSVLLNENVFFEFWANAEKSANRNEMINKKGRNKSFVFFIDYLKNIKNRCIKKIPDTPNCQQAKILKIY